MSRISIAFFGAAVLYAFCGIALGIYMGISQDHALVPVHAHLNLLGWTTLALMGGFYALAGARAPAKIAWTNFVASNLGVVLSMPNVALIQLGKPPIQPMLVAGDLLGALGMVIFGLAVITVGRGSAAATA